MKGAAFYFYILTLFCLLSMYRCETDKTIINGKNTDAQEASSIQSQMKALFGEIASLLIFFPELRSPALAANNPLGTCNNNWHIRLTTS
ncbi:unnamed protein product [Leptidea sinapis]|uniref:Uncharacterized protein n=1 Tax=Leptidea sinapis TaxID=189913 RepID=A0A5E4R0H3_9NEOP|nr:unnamed protein product [Leptidea sinapis]